MGTGPEPRWISEPTLLAMHAAQIERYGGVHGVIDWNVVLSVLARPRQRWAYDEAADLADLAAAYVVGFARAQGFRDGNKRTALATGLVFLAINGSPLHMPTGDAYSMTLAAATRTLDDAAVTAILRRYRATVG